MLFRSGCDSLSAQPNFSYTGTGPTSNIFSESLGGGSNFTFNPGDTVTLDLTVPPFSRIDVSFAGGAGSVDNSAGSAALVQTLVFVVPDTGGPSTGPFNISGVVQGANTVLINFLCVNAGQNTAGATNANQAAAITDTTILSIVPGGLNGNIFGALSIPKFDNFFPNFVGQPRQISNARSAREIESDPNFLNQEFDLGVTIGEIIDFLNAKQELSKLGQDQEIAKRVVLEQSFDVEIAERDLEYAIEAEAAGRQAVRSDLGSAQSPSTTAEEMRQVLKDAQTRLAEAHAESDRLSQRRDELEESIDEVRRNATPESASQFERFLISTPQDKALLNKGFDANTVEGRRAASQELARMRDAFENNRINSTGGTRAPVGPLPDVAKFIPSLPDLTHLNARFDLATERRTIAVEEGPAAGPEGLLGDKKFNLWLGGNITLHRDRRSIGQDGESLSLDGGMSYLVVEDLNLGVSARYAHTDTEGDAGETIANTYTLSLFAQQRVFDEAVIEAIIAYSLVDLDLTFKNAGIVSGTGSIDATSLAAQTRISQQFALGGNWWVAPSIGASVVTTDRDAFTTSDGVAVGDSRSTQVALVGGPTFGTAWTVKGGGIHYNDLRVAPNFGLSANYNLGRFDRVVDANNNVFETDRFGLSGSAGVNFDLGQATYVAVKTSYAGIGSDQRNLSFAASINLPLN